MEFGLSGPRYNTSYIEALSSFPFNLQQFIFLITWFISLVVLFKT